MEILKQPYSDIMNMPVQRFYNLLKWKQKLDEQNNAALENIVEGLFK